ncbi:hypothetical protein HZF05_04940 [Sphingomonas sp. CGMCC 1.13654]|uniref:Anti-sigma factor NepR domain-containing protein n=1 Tax=Sphingomonas chungangi TaxID=2683589 RepID=A0A838L7A5_9SPHN|nr:NepR family anti-sigma factor [Sphingomonas chungangi]MBA2933438.1 hypothetical protein [Sphingomonas chungangi]MVW54771.1 hypothetical protein [Sphingomonas chungangi]
MSDGNKSKRGAKGSAGSGGDGKASDRDVGHALRSVYSKTVSEEIPTELLDLLGKLR